jgi:REP element-mobilizing transposase RayT
MARPLRIEFAGAVYHVTSRGNERRPTFRTNQDRLTFLRFLGETVERFGWSLTAWVLMTNHFHLVIRTAEPNLSRGMQWLNGRYAGWFNRTHHRSGHLFQGRFHAFLIYAFVNNEEGYLTATLRSLPKRGSSSLYSSDFRSALGPGCRVAPGTGETAPQALRPLRARGIRTAARCGNNPNLMVGRTEAVTLPNHGNLS